jgi:CheY-like chemotaxis protein
MAVVLVIDDEPDNREAVARFLRRCGHDPVCAANGREAMATLIETNASVVLLDLSMPEMDGVEFLRAMRSYLRWITLPVIVITGISDTAMIDRATDLGVKHVFRKAGFDFFDLLERVNTEAAATA